MRNSSLHESEESEGGQKKDDTDFREEKGRVTKVLEGGGSIHIIDEDAAIGTTVEGNSEGLETLLAGSIPNLKSEKNMRGLRIVDLHGHETIINHDFFGQEISANGGFVLVGEFRVHKLVHQGCFADTDCEEDAWGKAKIMGESRKAGRQEAESKKMWRD